MYNVKFGNVKLSLLMTPFLLLLCVFYLVNTRIVGNLMVFDILIFLFIIYYLIINPGFKIKKPFVNGILILNICMIPCILLLAGVENEFNSIMFVAQYLMIINILPIFFLILQEMNLVHKFNRLLLYCFIINGILFVVYWFLFYFTGANHFLHFSNIFMGRISFGNFVPNDIAYFVLLGFFLVDQEFLHSKAKHFLYGLVSLPYFFSFSRTVILVTIIFFIFRSKRIAVFLGILVCFAFVFANSFQDIPIKRLFDARIDLEGRSETTNTERAIMIHDGFQALSQTLTHPIYGVPENVQNKNLFMVSSLHNIFLAIPVDFGAISGIMIMLVIFIWILSRSPLFVKNKAYRVRMLYFFLFFFILMFNPLQATRTFWIVIVMALLYPIQDHRQLLNGCYTLTKKSQVNAPVLSKLSIE